MANYDVENVIATISENKKQGTAKKLTLTSWNGNPAKLDLRTWLSKDNGSLVPGKGITLNETEAQDLYSALQVYYSDDYWQQ